MKDITANLIPDFFLASLKKANERVGSGCSGLTVACSASTLRCTSATRARRSCCKEIPLHAVWTGQELVGMVGPVFSCEFQNSEPNTQEEAELIGGFFQALMDLDEVDIIGPGERVRFEFEMTEWLLSLAENGFFVLVGHYDQWLCLETRRERWPVGVVRVERLEDCP